MHCMMSRQCTATELELPKTARNMLSKYCRKAVDAGSLLALNQLGYIYEAGLKGVV